MEKNDQQLIADFLAGDDASFELLVNRHLKAVYNFLFRLTGGDATLTDDLTQETFLKAWKHIKRFDVEKKFKVWLFAIAKNSAKDFWKKKKTLPFSLFENSEGYNRLDEVAEDKPLPDEILERVESTRELEEKIKKLPGKYQTILFLRYRDDLSVAEIASVLEMPYNTVKSQHQRALNALKKEFAPISDPLS
ncbi:MAG: sigma-70 family RNA polymerase sigma factor [Candidatus Moranbacteria bacterium]|nr:sigma-70 family RNA polymerase sigma factor [Candidatus Moranbacteria bacterium]